MFVPRASQSNTNTPKKPRHTILEKVGKCLKTNPKLYTDLGFIDTHAYSQGFDDLIEEIGLKERFYPLHIAAEEDDPKIAQYLLDVGMREKVLEDCPSFIYYFMEKPDRGFMRKSHRIQQIVSDIISEKSSENSFENLSPLLQMMTPKLEQVRVFVSNRWQEFCRRLRGSNIDVNEFDMMDKVPLHYASSSAMAELLVKHGAYVEAKQVFEWTALHYASYKGRAGVASVLIKHGANVNVRNDKQETPLHNALDRDVAEVLLSNGADVNVKCSSKCTPLHNAASKRDKDLIAVLVGYGANLNTLNWCGKRATDIFSWVSKCIDKKDAELNRMKVSRPTDSMSLLDIMEARDPRYTLNFSRFELTIKNVKEEYPVHGSMIRAKIMKDRKLVESVPYFDSLMKNGGVLRGTTLPYELSVKILSYLKVKHLEDFIKLVKSDPSLTTQRQSMKRKQSE